MPPAESFPIYDTAAVDAVAGELRLPPQSLRRARTSFFKKAASISDTLGHLPAEARAPFVQRVRLSELTMAARHDSRVDGASRLVFRNAAGLALESVVLRAGTGRTALCVSSQVGCAAACVFCATGKMGVARDLTTAEILDQVVQANRLLASEQRRVRNIVFMGMGEPLHNERRVLAALDTLVAARGFHHPPSRVLVSTVGVPDAMLRLARAMPGVNYALSLHAAVQSTRETLVPLARRYPLDRLRTVVAEMNTLQPPARSVMLEYVMLRGVNDSPGDVAALLDWCHGLRVHVNLIPYNAIEDAPNLFASPRPVIEAAGRSLRDAGVPTTIRYSMGNDIAAACGQLARRENRQTIRLAGVSRPS